MPQSIPLTTVLRKLRTIYDPPKSFLRHRTPFDLLIVTILSAQCTDKRVNELSKILFAKYKKPEDYVKVTLSELESDIKSTGFYHNKAKNIQALCHMLLQNHGGNVPQTMEELTALPGVGRKTAAIILYAAFEKCEGVAVDTHVLRLSRRLGLSKHTTQDKIERDLMKAVPRKQWGEVNTLLVSHGRAVCTARNRKCEACVFRKECPSSGVMGRGDLAKKV
jgi:endonuclease III